MSREVLILGFGRLLQIVLVFATYRIMTEILDITQVGLFFLLTSIISYFSLVSVNPIGLYINRNIHQWSTGDLGVIVKSFTLLLCVLTLVATPVFYAVGYFFEYAESTQLFATISMLVYFFSFNLNNTLLPQLNFLDFKKTFVTLTLASYSGALLLSILIIFEIRSNATLWLAGHSIAFLLAGLTTAFSLILLARQKRKIDKKSNNSLLKIDLLRFCAPLALANIFMWILTQAYRPFTEYALGTDQLAFLGLGLGLAASITTAYEYFLHQILYPSYYKEISSGNSTERIRAWRRLCGSLIPAMLVLAIFISGMSPFLMHYLASEKFSEAFVFLAVGAWIEILRVILSQLTLQTHAENKTRLSLLPYGAGALTTILLFTIALWIQPKPHWILVAIACGNLVAIALYILRNNLNYRHSFSLKRLLKLVLPSLLFVAPNFIMDANPSNLSSFVVLTTGAVLFFLIQYNILFKAPDTKGEPT